MKPSSPAPNLLRYWIVLWCFVILISASSFVVAVDVSEEIPNQHGGMTKRKDSDSFGAAAWGGPHSYRTWSRQWLNYPGACDLVLLHDPHFGHGLGLAIHIRTTSTAPTTTLSSQSYPVYLEQAALRIGTDILQVNSAGEYYLNGIKNAALPAIMGQVAWVSQIQQGADHQQQILEVDLDHQDTKIIFQTFQGRISVSVEIGKDSNKQNFLGSIGLLGANLNGAVGEVQARDGETFLITESSAIGKEWQVRDTDDKLFQDMDRFPQYPSACIVPSHDDNTPWKEDHKRRRLSEMIMLSKDDAREVCAMWKHDKKDMAACMYDVLFMGKLDTALIAGIF